METQLDYTLNINTLNGDEFTINILNIPTRNSDFMTWLNTHLQIRKGIASYYEQKLFDENGVSDAVINQIKTYRPQHQTLIHNDKILTHEQLLKGKVRLNNNDCITVIFSS